MSLILGGAWLLLAALWQAAALPQPSLLGSPVDFAVVLVLVWAYVRSPEDAIVLAVIGGIAIDALSAQPLGVTVLALLPAAVLGSIRGARMLDTEWGSTILLALAATLVYHLVLLTMLNLTLTAPIPGSVFIDQALPAALLNALIAPIVYLIVWTASFDVRPTRRQIRTND